MTPSLRRLVTGEMSPHKGDLVEVSWRPRPVPAALRNEAARVLADLEQDLRPAGREWISGRIVTLMAHYWTPDLPELMGQAVAKDWIAVLADFPRHAIEIACQEYLSADTRARPTPGQIRKLCEAVVGDRIRERDRLRLCLDMKPDSRAPRQQDTPEQRERALKSVGDIMAKLRAEPDPLAKS